MPACCPLPCLPALASLGPALGCAECLLQLQQALYLYPLLPPPFVHTVVIACAVGGTLDTVVRVASTGKQAKDPDRSFGRETRSLKAVYELMGAGYSNVLHLKGGLSQWRCVQCSAVQCPAGAT